MNMMKKMVILLFLLIGMQSDHVCYASDPDFPRAHRVGFLRKDSASTSGKQHTLTVRVRGHASSTKPSQVVPLQMVAQSAVQDKIAGFMQTTDIEGILKYRDSLKDQLYDRPRQEHVGILHKIEAVECQLQTNLAPLVECYEKCDAQRLQGDWFSLNARHGKLEAFLKNPDLSGEERFRLEQEKAILGCMLRDPSTNWLMALADGHTQAALRSWQSIEAGRADGSIDRKTFLAAKAFYDRRQEELRVAAQSAQLSACEGAVLDTAAPQIHAPDSDSHVRLEDVTDMTTDRPEHQALSSGIGFSDKEMAQFQAFHEQVIAELKREGLIPQETLLERSPELSARFVRKVVHNLHPAEVASRWGAGLEKLACGMMTPIGGVKGRSEKGGHPVAQVYNTLSQVDLSQLTAEQVVDFTALVTADAISGKLVAGAGSYLAALDISDTVLKATEMLPGAQEILEFAGGAGAITLDVSTVKDVAEAVETVINVAGELVEAGAKVASSTSAGNTLLNEGKKVEGGGDSSASRYTLKNGRYEDASYHSARGNSVKSAKPLDGQHALDNSLPLPRNTDRRVAVSNNQIVILDKTSDGLYHGHVRTWKELDNDVIEAVLRKAGLVTKRGKIKQ